jgi:hypothetical protein
MTETVEENWYNFKNSVALRDKKQRTLSPPVVHQDPSMLETPSLALRFRRFFLCRPRLNCREVLGVLAILSYFVFPAVYFNEKSNFREIMSQRLVLFKRPYQIESDGQMVSYCSLEADRRGPNQNVISYSLYGNFSDPDHFKKYAQSIELILPKIKQFYPGYHHFTI